MPISKRKWPVLVVLLLTLVTVVPDIAQTTDKTLTIAADFWCPINCDPGAAQPGIGVELAQKIFEPLGYKVNYVVMPWSRVLEEVRAGHINAAIGTNKQDDPTLLFPTQPISPMTDDFYVLAARKTQFKNMDSLKGLSVGVVVDYGYSKPVQAFVERYKRDQKQIQFVGGDDALEQNIRKLLAERVDVIIESRAVMNYTLKRMGLTGKVRHIGSIHQGDVYLAFSPVLKESKTHIRQYDEGFARLKAGGEVRKLYQRYDVMGTK